MPIGTLGRCCHCGSDQYGCWAREATPVPVPNDPIPYDVGWTLIHPAESDILGVTAQLPYSYPGDIVQLAGVRFATQWPWNEGTQYGVRTGRYNWHAPSYHRQFATPPILALDQTEPLTGYPVFQPANWYCNPTAGASGTGSHLLAQRIKTLLLKTNAGSAPTGEWRARYIRFWYNGVPTDIRDCFESDPTDWSAASSQPFEFTHDFPFVFHPGTALTVDVWVEYRAQFTGTGTIAYSHTTNTSAWPAQLGMRMPMSNVDLDDETFEIAFYGGYAPAYPDNAITFGTLGSDTLTAGFAQGIRTTTTPDPFDDFRVTFQWATEMPAVNLLLYPALGSLEGVSNVWYLPSPTSGYVRTWWQGPVNVSLHNKWFYAQQPGGTWNLSGSRRFDLWWPVQTYTGAGVPSFVDQSYVYWPSYCIVTRKLQ